MKKIIKIINNYILLVLFFILSYIIPKKKKLYIFWSLYWKWYMWNSKALYSFMKKKYKNYDVYFLTKSKKLLKLHKSFIYSYSIKWIFLLLRANFIFITNWISDLSITNILIWKFNIINLWHWDPLKRMWFSVDNKKIIYNKLLKFYYKKMYNFTVCSSEFSRKNMMEAFWNKNVIITGLPRNDILVNDMKYKNNRLKQKIILYAPTFRDKHINTLEPFSKSFYIELNNYCKNNNFIFYIKPHPNTKQILNFKNNFSNIKIINDDIQSILLKTEILITDYSSVYIDFLLTKKPIIFYSYDLNKYINDRNFYIDYKKWIINKSLVYNEKDLLKNLKNNSYFNREEYLKEYNNLLNLFHKYKDWKYCERVLNYLLNKK